MGLKKLKQKEQPAEYKEVRIVDMSELMTEIWKELIDKSFCTTSPLDGKALSVIREADVFEVLSNHMEDGDKLEY